MIRSPGSVTIKDCPRLALRASVIKLKKYFSRFKSSSELMLIYYLSCRLKINHHVNKGMQFRPPRAPLLYKRTGVFSCIQYFFIIYISIKFQWNFGWNMICFSILIARHVFYWQYKLAFFMICTVVVVYCWNVTVQKFIFCMGVLTLCYLIKREKVMAIQADGQHSDQLPLLLVRWSQCKTASTATSSLSPSEVITIEQNIKKLVAKPLDTRKPLFWEQMCW